MLVLRPARGFNWAFCAQGQDTYHYPYPGRLWSGLLSGGVSPPCLLHPPLASPPPAAGREGEKELGTGGTRGKSFKRILSSTSMVLNTKKVEDQKLNH